MLQEWGLKVRLFLALAVDICVENHAIFVFGSRYNLAP